MRTLKSYSVIGTKELLNLKRTIKRQAKAEEARAVPQVSQSDREALTRIKVRLEQIRQLKEWEAMPILFDQGGELDPFVGSGTTCIAAKRLGLRYIGFEINPKFKKIADDRLDGFNQKGVMNLFDCNFN